MKVRNIIASLLAVPVLVGMTACSEKEADYTAAQVLSGEQVFFPNDMSTTIELSTEENSFTVPLNRVKTTERTAINLVSTSSSASIAVPSTALFEEGTNVTDITITYDPEQVEAGRYDTLTIAISDDSYTTPYGATNVTLLVGQAEPWVSLGTGWFYDGFMDDYSWRVQIEQNQLNPTLYRVVAPYRAMWNYYGQADRVAASSDYLTFRIFPAGTVLGQNSDGEEVATPKDDCVFFADVNTGYFHSTYNQYILALHPANFYSTSTPEKFANNSVVAYNEDGTPGEIALAPYYYMDGVGGWNHTSDPGYIDIYMPGYEPKDFSVYTSYKGKYYDADDNLFIVASVDSLGEDVAETRLTVTEGKDSYSAGINAILGAEEGDESVVSIVGVGKVNIPFPADAESGKYTITAVSYDEEGEAQSYSYATFNYVAANAEEDTWTLVGTGDYTYSVFFGSVDEPAVDEGLALYRNDKNPALFKIEHWGYDVDFLFTMDAEGNVLVADQETGYTHSTYGMVSVDDCVDAYEDTEHGVSSYDAETGTFNFAVVYYVSAGAFGRGIETFQLNAASKARSAKAKQPKRLGQKAATQSLSSKTTQKCYKVRGYQARAQRQAKPAMVEKATPSYDLFSKYAR